MQKSIIFLYSIITYFVFLTACNNRSSDPKLELSDLDLLRGDLILCSGKSFGDVTFSLSCKYSVRETFNLAVSLLHSFQYPEAEKAFVKVLDIDPECAMAYWGVAMSIYHAAWFPPSEEEMIRASKILNIAEPIRKTTKESNYFDAIQSYYNNWESISHSKRAKKYEDHMETMHELYPDDTEVSILYSLALFSTRDRVGKDHLNERKAGQILEQLYQAQPNHPGIAHYLIHNYDNPVLAHKALGVSRRYAEIAPGSAHAQHMPSHIFTRLGLWDESVSSNINSYEAARCYMQETDMEGHYFEEVHAMDYLVYAYLQKGDNMSAYDQSAKLKDFDGFYNLNMSAVAYALSAIPTRIALETRDWQSASQLSHQTTPLDWANYPWQNAILHFGRALGFANTAKLSQAETEIKQLLVLQQDLVNMNIPSASNQIDQIGIQIKSAQAWLAFRSGTPEEALMLMREASDMESQTSKHPVTPGDVLPANELLGDMLLEMNRPEEALVAYQANLAVHPNRFNGVYGAAVASRSIEDRENATQYFTQLVALSDGVKIKRHEVEEALAYLNQM